MQNQEKNSDKTQTLLIITKLKDYKKRPRLKKKKWHCIIVKLQSLELIFTWILIFHVMSQVM